MIAIEKNTFLEFELVNLQRGNLSRCQSDSTLHKSPSRSSSKYYFFDFHGGQSSNSSVERSAPGKHDEVSLVEDVSMVHVDSFDRTTRGNIHTPCKQLRPDKKQRALFAQFVKEQRAKLVAQPHDFDIELIDIPISLWRKGGVETSVEQLKRTLYAVKATLTTQSWQ